MPNYQKIDYLMYKILIIFILFTYQALPSEFANTQSFGVYFFAGNSFHTVDFNEKFKSDLKDDLAYIDSTFNNFNKGSGDILSFNIDYNLRIFNDFYLNIGANIDYDYGEFNFFFNDLININGVATEGLIADKIEYKLLNLSSFMGVKYNIYKKLNLRLLYNLSHSRTIDFSSYEKIIKPENKGVFKQTGKKIRNEFIDTISLNQISSSLSFGIDYLFPTSVSSKLNLNPFVYVNYDLDGLMPTQTWNRINLFYGLGIIYYFGEVPHLESITLNPDQIVIPTINFTYRINKNGKEEQIDSLIIEKHIFNTYSFYKNDGKVNSTQKTNSKNIGKFNSLDLHYKIDQVFNNDKLYFNLQNQNEKKIFELDINQNIFIINSDEFTQFIKTSELKEIHLEMLRNNKIYKSNSQKINLIFSNITQNWYEYNFTKDFTIQEILNNLISFIADSKKLNKLIIIEANDSALLNKLAGEIDYFNILIKQNNKSEQIKIYWENPF